jgi:hypothetical protein
MGLGAWSGLISLRIGTVDGLLWMGWWTSGFHKMRGISWLSWGTSSFSRMALTYEVRYKGSSTLSYWWGEISRDVVIFSAVCSKSGWFRPIEITWPVLPGGSEWRLLAVVCSKSCDPGVHIPFAPRWASHGVCHVGCHVCSLLSHSWIASWWVQCNAVFSMPAIWVNTEGKQNWFVKIIQMEASCT